VKTERNTTKLMSCRYHQGVGKYIISGKRESFVCDQGVNPPRERLGKRLAKNTLHIERGPLKRENTRESKSSKTGRQKRERKKLEGGSDFST